TNLSNDKSVVVRINDRGPHTRSRLIDLSRQAARQLDMLRSGTAKVRVQGLSD
ncbi:MAG: septal ring lytic transglycosylase RlpA family lipoprotein, partial [Pseudomonas sp.]|nr:septal ring lytic transglycosylase RlpA family lipoprotein [Pseudomonas sp.]